MIEGMVNPSVAPEDEILLSGQNLKVYERLLEGPATNVQLQAATGSMAIHSRIADVRGELAKHGLAVYGKPVKGGLWLYRIEKIK